MSLYNIKKATNVALIYKGTEYRLEAIVDYQYSQTFEKSVKSRKTLHRKSSLPSTIVKGKSPGSGSLSVNSTSTFAEGILLELIGMESFLPGSYEFPENLTVEPEYFSLVVTLVSGKMHVLSNCVLSNLDISLSKSSGIVFSVGLAFGDLTEMADYDFILPTTGILESQGSIHNSAAPLKVRVAAGNSDPILRGLISTNVSFQQTINWRTANTLHTRSILTTPTRAVLTDRPFSGVIALYDRNDTEQKQVMHDASVLINYGFLTISITNATLTKRNVISDVFQTQYDISLQGSTLVAVEYGAKQ